MKKLMMSSAMLLLTGCTAYGEKFDCGAGRGVGCKSLSFVNAQVEKGILPFDTDEEKTLLKVAALETPPLSRSGAKVWIAAHRDEQGFYHEPSYVRLR